MAEDFSDKNKDYGLPKVEPQPINRDQPGIISDPPKVISEQEDKRDNKLVIIVLSVVGALILASLLYILFWDHNGEGEVPGEAMVEDRVVLDPEETNETPLDNAEPNQAELSEATPVITEEPGSIVTISERTNRYYIFVGSYKFRAYARRHAEQLAADGFAVKLITPDNWVGMRVAVGNYASVEEAGVDAEQIRSRYGNEVVISKY